MRDPRAGSLTRLDDSANQRERTSTSTGSLLSLELVNRMMNNFMSGSLDSAGLANDGLSHQWPRSLPLVTIPMAKKG